MTPTVPDGPDTEDVERALVAADGGRAGHWPAVAAVLAFEVRHLRAVLARPAAGRDPTAPKHLLVGDRVETADGARATVTGSAPRGPRGEPAVNLAWDGDAGGPAYEHDLLRVPGGSAGRDLTAQDVRAAVNEAWRNSPPTWNAVAEHLTRIARPAVARTDGQPPADDELYEPLRAEIRAGEAAHDRRIGRPAAPADDTAAYPRVAGRCPSCGRESLRAMVGGHVTCSRLECPEPTAVDDLLHRAPADDTAAPDAAPRPDWSGAWAELTGYVRAATEPIDPARIDAYMVELKREALRPFREWWEQLAAGQPVRDSQDGGDRG